MPKGKAAFMHIFMRWHYLLYFILRIDISLQVKLTIFTMEAYIANIAGVAAESFGNEVVLLNLLKGNYYSMRGETSVAIWQMLEAGSTAAQIANMLPTVFDVTPEMALEAAEACIQKLSKEELVVAYEGAVAERTFEGKGHKVFTFPELEVYTDLQNMIMLDPVHDVDSVKGWPAQRNENDNAGQ
jgi:hypothetical protein